MDDSLSPDTLLSSGTQAITSTRVSKAMPVPQTDHTSFPILKLPLEIRDLIYGFALISSPLRTHRYCGWFKPGFEPYICKNQARPSLNLLLANHQLYSEASRVLYHEGCFIIPSFMAVAQQFFFFELSEHELSRLGLTALDDKWYSNIRNIEIEIGYYYGCWHPIKHDWQGDFGHVKRVLASLPHLKAITVAWQFYMEAMPDYDLPGDVGFARLYILKLLGAFGSFERSHPAVKITVQDAAKDWPFEKQVGRRGVDRSLQDFMAELECEIQKGLP